MGSPKMLGMTRVGIPNRRADLRRAKAWKRNREYTDRHEIALVEKQEKRQNRELEAMKRGNQKTF